MLAALQTITEGFEAQLETTRVLTAHIHDLEGEVTKLWEDIRELRKLLVLAQVPVKPVDGP